MTDVKNLLLALLSGTLLALPFFERCPELLRCLLPFLGLSLLLHIFTRSSIKAAFFYGWLTGLIFFGLGVSWVYISIHDFGDVPVLISAFITFTFSAVLGLFYGVHGYLLNRFFRSKTADASFAYAVLAFPALGVLMELLKSVIFSGFPWLEIGMTQINGPLAGWAPLLGSYGLSYGVYLIVGLSRKSNYLVLAFFFILLILGLGQGLKLKPWTSLDKISLRVSLVQGNIPQSLKWNEDNLRLSLQRYAELSQDLPISDLIVWPETAIPLSQIDADSYLDALIHYLKIARPQTTLITGIPFFDPLNETYFNAAIALGNGEGRYLKQHLVPFGEYLPFRPLFGWVFQFLHIPMSDFSAGPAAQTLIRVGPYSIATFICYESAFSELFRQSAKRSNILVVLSDDAWFGDSAGPYQHLQINQMRALENGRPLLSASNNGITAVIAPNGKLIKRLTSDEKSTLTTDIFPAKGETPFEHTGIWPLLIGMTLCCVTAKRKIS